MPFETRTWRANKRVMLYVQFKKFLPRSPFTFDQETICTLLDKVIQGNPRARPDNDPPGSQIWRTFSIFTTPSFPHSFAASCRILLHCRPSYHREKAGSFTRRVQNRCRRKGNGHNPCPVSYASVHLSLCNTYLRKPHTIGSEIKIGSFYEPTLLYDFAGSYFQLAQNKLNSSIFAMNCIN
jgi:hypothetical protein